nr:transcriptional regulator [Helicobacter pylori]
MIAWLSSLKGRSFFATPNPNRFYHQDFTFPCVLQRYAISK